MIRRARLHPNRARLIAGWRSRPMKSPRGWKRRFDDPIPLPRGRQLVTLKDGERRSQRPDLLNFGARGLLSTAGSARGAQMDKAAFDPRGFAIQESVPAGPNHRRRL